MTDPRSLPFTRITTVTEDGAHLWLDDFGDPPHRLHDTPVICCHGFACNSLLYRAHPEFSLARRLYQAGYRVYLLTLRGRGQEARQWDWSFDHYLRFDLPAALEHVRQEDDAARVHFIGHSMGGMLLYAALSTSPAVRRQIASGVTIGSTLDYSGYRGGFHKLRIMRKAMSHLESVPIGKIARANAELNRFGYTPFDAANVARGHTEASLWRRLCREGFVDVSSRVMVQLGSSTEVGGLTTEDGRQAYSDRLDEVQNPVLALAGDADGLCPAKAAAATALRLPHGRFEAFGKRYGHQRAYGHFDLLTGRDAPRVVYPKILDWLSSSAHGKKINVPE